MSDDKSKVGSPDRDRINVHEAYVCSTWLKKFGVSADQLKAAVSAVGPTALSLSSNVTRHQGSWDEDEASMLEKITLDELYQKASKDANALKPDPGHFPDRLTLARLQELFAPCLHTETIGIGRIRNSFRSS